MIFENEREIVELERLRVGLLYKQSFVTQTTGVINAAIYVYISLGLVASTSLMFWGCLVVTVLAARLAEQFWFNHRFIEPQRKFNPKLGRRFFAGALLLRDYVGCLSEHSCCPKNRFNIKLF